MFGVLPSEKAVTYNLVSPKHFLKVAPGYHFYNFALYNPQCIGAKPAPELNSFADGLLKGTSPLASRSSGNIFKADAKAGPKLQRCAQICYNILQQKLEQISSVGFQLPCSKVFGLWIGR